MAGFTRTVALAAVVGMGAATMPMQTLAASGPMAAKSVQTVKKPLKVTREIRAGRWVPVVQGPLRTNAGQRITVTAVGRTPKGKRVAADSLRTLQQPKQFSVWAAPRTRVVVRLSAPATPKYAAFSQRYKVRVKGRVPANRTRGFAVGMQAAGTPWADFWAGLLQSFTDEYFGGTAGFVLSALMGSNGKSNELQPILDELKKIQSQINDISDQINDLRRDVAFAACQGQTTEAAQAVAVIQTANQRYINLIKSKETSPALLSRWVEEVLNVTSVQTSINTIHNVLTGLGGTTGSLGACGQALQAKWVKPLDEDGYYRMLWNYLGFFYQAEVLGMNMLIDANHYKAAEAAKAAKQQLPEPEYMGRFLCDRRFGPPAGKTWCNAALQVANIVYYDMLKQAEQAGAAYAWNTYGRGRDPVAPNMATQKGTSLVWWLDLNTWKPEVLKRNGCTLPLSSKNPCGPLVGKGELRGTEGEFGFYETWNTADENQWAALLNLKQNGGAKLSEVMESVGFAKGKSDNLIVLTRNRAPVGFPGGYDRNGTMEVDRYLGEPARGSCFLDTNFPTTKGGPGWPLCAQDGLAFFAFTNTYTRSGDSNYSYETSDWAKKYGTDPTFYTSRFEGAIDWKKQRWYSTHAVKAPGWLTTSSGNGGMDEYRWPVVDLNTVKCKVTEIGMEKIDVDGKNKGGAYSMCGYDLYWWLRFFFPLPPPEYKAVG